MRTTSIRSRLPRNWRQWTNGAHTAGARQGHLALDVSGSTPVAGLAKLAELGRLTRGLLDAVAVLGEPTLEGHQAGAEMRPQPR